MRYSCIFSVLDLPELMSVSRVNRIHFTRSGVSCYSVPVSTLSAPSRIQLILARIVLAGTIIARIVLLPSSFLLIFIGTDFTVDTLIAL